MFVTRPLFAVRDAAPTPGLPQLVPHFPADDDITVAGIRQVRPYTLSYRTCRDRIAATLVGRMNTLAHAALWLPVLSAINVKFTCTPSSLVTLGCGCVRAQSAGVRRCRCRCRCRGTTPARHPGAAPVCPATHAWMRRLSPPHTRAIALLLLLQEQEDAVAAQAPAPAPVDLSYSANPTTLDQATAPPFRNPACLIALSLAITLLYAGAA